MENCAHLFTKENIAEILQTDWLLSSSDYKKVNLLIPVYSILKYTNVHTSSRSPPQTTVPDILYFLPISKVSVENKTENH